MIRATVKRSFRCRQLSCVPLGIHCPGDVRSVLRNHPHMLDFAPDFLEPPLW